MAVALAAASLAGCGSDSTGGATTAATIAGTVRTDDRRPPEAGAVIAALAPLPGGGLRGGELTTGRVRDLDGEGRPRGRVLVTLPVSTGGQRGLLGLVVDRRGRTFAAFTERGGRERLVVEQVLPGPRRRVWTGPPSTDLADGGHLVLLGGRLVIGVGDLQDPARIPDDDAPNGKLLALDPDRGGGQEPRILSRGWNNPYAFAPYPDDAGDGDGLLVADNAPGRRPERIARGDAGGGAPRQVTDLPGRVAPSGLAVIGPAEVAVCGVVSRRLDRYRLVAGRWRRAGVISRQCAYGVTRLADGRLAISADDGVRVVRP
ncbi:hypothetical protein DSM112329_03737 [Paraconexibacter sp. AEG42_29]|uniref:Glucose/Sorbosone dehydrogenase domain-containing protein n=1 Tax=Paraconexibacter sp. AEG42_29 TaxID=2997339 RepID=A0AAU7AZW3_9ACTN